MDRETTLVRAAHVGAVLLMLMSGSGCRLAERSVLATDPPERESGPMSPLPTGTPFASEETSSLDGRILFHRRETTGWMHIYVLDTTTGELTALTTGPANNYDPAWSPDGSVVAFVSDRSDQSTYGTLWIMDSDGRNARSLLPPGPFIELGPTWSPDGSRIAFQSNRQGNQDVLMVDVETETVTSLTTYPGIDANPAWSPDGAHIAFVSDREGSPDVWVIEVGTGHSERVTRDTSMGEWRPAWSPDGTRLVYESYSTVAPRLLMIQDVASGEVVVLDTGSVWNTWPTWAADNLIVYASSDEYDEDSHRPSPASLYMQDLGTGATRQLTSGQTADGRPTWRP